MKKKIKRAVALVMLAGFVVVVLGCASYVPLNRGHSALERSDYDTAITEFSGWLNSRLNQFSTSRPHAYSARGRAYLGKGDFDSAIRDFEAALRRPPNRDFENFVRNNLTAARQQQIAALPPEQRQLAQAAATVTPGVATAPRGIYGYFHWEQRLEPRPFITTADWRPRPLNSIYITNYVGPPGAVVIPSTINGIPVTHIRGREFYDHIWWGNGAFENSGITSITIPNNVTHIGPFAFYNNQLSSVTIPNSVTHIQGSSFAGNRLTSVTIGNSVTFIGGSAFARNPLTNVTIPDNVRNIMSAAFFPTQLTRVTIGTNVSITANSFPPGFQDAYNVTGQFGGTYTRPDLNSTTWRRQ